MFVELKLGVACAQSYSRRGSQTRCRNKRVPIVNDYPATLVFKGDYDTLATVYSGHSETAPFCPVAAYRARLLQ